MIYFFVPKTFCLVTMEKEKVLLLLVLKMNF